MQLARENNRMLHKMRRNSFIGGVVRVIFYFLILVVAPLYVYTTYVAPLVQNLQSTLQQVQGTNAAAQQQLNGFEQAWKSFESKLPWAGSTSSAAQ